MITKPKNILQFTIRILGIALIFFQIACKSTQPTPSTPSIPQEPVEVVEEEVNEDSIRLTQNKEYALNSYRAAAPRIMDLVHMDLAVGFDFDEQVVIGDAILTLTPYARPQTTMTLDAQDFEWGKVNLVESDEETSLGYRYDDRELLVYFPDTVAVGDTVQLRLAYQAFPERNAREGSAAITDTKGLYFIDPLDTIDSKPTMIWTQGETSHNSKWFPTIDEPNERFTHQIKVSVPDTMVSVSNGKLINQEKADNGLRVDTWLMDLPHAPYLVALAIGDFEKVSDSYEEIPLGYYVERGYGAGAKKVFQHTPEMIEYFEDLLGVEYPWQKYDQIVVRDFVSGAMENTTASIFMEELRLDEREAIDSEWDYIIAHELFHQWFGDYVTTESWSNLTLNEAFANYSEFLWHEYKYGEDEAKLKLMTELENYLLESDSKQVDLIRFQYASAEDMFDSHSYSKGGWVLHQLRKYLGDRLFFEGLKHYLNENALNSVEVHDLRLAFEEVSGEDLNWFFNQWFLDKGHPQLAFEVDYSVPENLLITVRQKQNLENTPLYRIPFKVSWYAEGKRQEKTFILERAFQQFALENKQVVDQVYIDEQKDLLAVRQQELSPEFMVRQFKESEFGVARYEALDSLSAWEAEDQLKELIAQALEDEFWAVRESALRVVQNYTEWLGMDPELEEQVYLLAEEDSRNSVRAGAIDVLSAFDADKYYQAFRRFANDSSYLIVSSALMAINQTETTSIDVEFIEGFAQSSNYRVAVPLAEYYLTKELKGKGNWFRQKTEELSGEGLYYFLGYFSEYFVRNPEEGKNEAVEYLFSELENSGQVYVRLGAFQGLLGFADEAGVAERLRKAVAGESNQEIKNYMEYFLQALSDEN
ncbi:M1 family metallopeptidase [Algoriphagus hitonicola]|uniref:Aminopeptidase N n=1 Tax=Algoriphagus hitonicola TaxID=435880 RepID=A0A1I2U845_9BACT|nr:M1 family metallopeptidase [Algoriphagus hitonicola]SFG73290.1 aminopeptidase N [Algoriphagus hitonicola]